MIKDIDLSGVTESEGFKPIGDDSHRFQGSFDGKKKIIRNLKIDRPKEDDVGLFGNVGKDGSISYIGLEDVDVKGKNNVGGLVGANGGDIRNSYAMARVTVTSFSERSIGGGLVGYNHGGEIFKSYATGNVIGKVQVGGYAGAHDGVIENSYAMGEV